jgi:ABC-type multidrug transport system permease subunit
MSVAAVLSVGLGAAQRQVVRTLKTPALLLPVLLFPLLLFGSFVGGASGVSKTPGFGYYNYTAFVFVYVLLIGAGMSGAQTGIALAQDFESGFARRMLVSTPRRAAVLVGCAFAGLAQQTGLAAVTFLIALAAGMPIDGNVLEVLGVFALAALFNLVATLWSSGLAFRAQSTQAGPAMMFPILLPMFFAPSLAPRNLLTGWLHSITDYNPITALLEAGRGLLAGHPVSVVLAFGILGGLVAVTALWGVSGLWAAERGS